VADLDLLDHGGKERREEKEVIVTFTLNSLAPQGRDGERRGTRSKLDAVAVADRPVVRGKGNRLECLAIVQSSRRGAEDERGRKKKNRRFLFASTRNGISLALNAAKRKGREKTLSLSHLPSVPHVACFEKKEEERGREGSFS